MIAPTVKRCAGTGLQAGANTLLTLTTGALHDNLGTGLVAQQLQRLAVTDTIVCNNQGGALRTISTALRRVGGIFATSAPAIQEFSGNQIFDNVGDQLAIGLGSGTWNLDGAAGSGPCGTGSNAFSGYAAGAYGLVAAGNVTALFNGWLSGIPTLGTDVLKVGTPSVTLGSEPGHSEYCPLPVSLTCPDP